MNRPTLIEAAKLVAYDNGMIDARNTEQDVVANMLLAAVSSFTSEELDLAEKELSEMTKEDLEEFCCGEQRSDWYGRVSHRVLNTMFTMFNL